MLTFQENFLEELRIDRMKSFHIELEKESYLESNAYTIGLLNTNTTDFSDPPLFSKKTSINNPQTKVPFVNYSNTAYNINPNSDYANNYYSCKYNMSIGSYGHMNSFNFGDNYKRSRKQEIELEIEKNSLIQLNLVLQSENSPLRIDYILNIGGIVLLSFIAYILEVLILEIDYIIM